MSPDDTYTEKRDKSEKDRLDALVTKLDDKQKSSILKRGLCMAPLFLEGQI